ncbi:OmpA family protein [Lunatibacter salilacus]|uniref:OmpA family protein n=1 Tax=Lunatibacter salilacus TaxID=2483804 RepID=UPI00131A90A2|nr:OmpA family protein [Lunatibacter salilacus]
MPFKKALLTFAVAFFAFNTICAQVPLPVSNVNSSFDELHPVIHTSGDLYFTRVLQPGNTGNGGSGDIWKSSLVSEGEFSEPAKVDEFATDSYDLIIGFPDDQTAYVFHHHYEGMHGIFVYQLNGGYWQMDSALNIPGLRSLGANFNGRLSQNGEMILMSMQSFGSYGNEDLYITRWNDRTNSWSRPINLGPTINSSYQELTPFYKEEDNILFFSSNRPDQGSGYQLFYSLRLDDTFSNWSLPVPLTFLDKEGITLSFMENQVNGNTFFTSTSSSEGYGDIFLLPSEITAEINKIISVDQRGKKQPIPEVYNITKPTDEQIPNLGDTTSIPEKAESTPLTIREKRQYWIDHASLHVNDFSIKVISPNGEILSTNDYAALDAEDGSWIMSVPGYIPLKIDWNQPFSKEYLTPVEPGSRLDLSVIQFERSSSQLTDSLSIGYINTLADFLISSPTIKIGLEGHTDNLGNVELNKTLSTLRASQIRDLLVKQGVDFERIRVAGYGGTRPKADNRTEAGRILNRRVELVVLEN